MPIISKQVTLVNRPARTVKISDFKIIESVLPELQEGEVLLKTLYFSLDPYMKSRMHFIRGSYVEPFKLGAPLEGAAVCVIEESKNKLLKVGDLVLSDTGWQTFAISKPELSERISRETNKLMKLSHDVKSTVYLGALGMPGLAAYYGLLKIGQPKAEETLLVSSATGAVGSVVGQIGKLKGCRVVGIAGGSKKCQIAIREFGFDACVDYRSKTFLSDLKEACPNGVDIYFENVGGTIFKAVLPLLKPFARIPLCGLISYYNDAPILRDPNFKLSTFFPKLKAFSRLFFHLDYTAMILFTLLANRAKIEGFIIIDHFDEYPEFFRETLPLIQSGKIRCIEDIVKGIENAPEAFIGLLSGKNLGKLIIEI